MSILDFVQCSFPILVVTSFQGTLTQVPPFLWSIPFHFSKTSYSEDLLMVRPLSRVGTGNRIQEAKGVWGCKCRRLSACTGLQVVSAMGWVFLSPHPMQPLPPVLIRRVQILIIYTLVLGFCHKNTGSCLESSFSEGLLCFSTKDIGQAGFVS